MKEEIKNLKTWTVHQRFQFIYKTILSYCLTGRKIRKVKTRGMQRQKMEE